MKLLCRFDATLIPSSEDSVESWEKLRRGDEYTVEVKRARNPKFHRLAFGMIRAMFDNQERFENFNDFRRELNLLIDHYEEFISADGRVFYEAKSWSFADMDDLEFREVYKKVREIALARFGARFVGHFENAAEWSVSTWLEEGDKAA